MWAGDVVGLLKDGDGGRDFWAAESHSARAEWSTGQEGGEGGVDWFEGEDIWDEEVLPMFDVGYINFYVKWLNG